MGCAPSKDGDGDTGNQKKNQYIRAERAAKSVVHQAAEAGQYSMMGGYESDTRCPLTERQLYSIVKSWKAINRDMIGTSVNMFIRLLEVEEIRNFFSIFKDYKNVADLRASELFQEHALMVVSTIDEVIANLDDMDYVMSLLTSTGEAHSVRFENFNPNFFKKNSKVEEAFLWAVKETLDDRFTISIENIYRITIRFILQILQESFINHRNGMKESTPTEKDQPESTDKVNDIITVAPVTGNDVTTDIVLTNHTEDVSGKEVEVGLNDISQ